MAYNFRCWLGTNKLIYLLDNPGLSTLQKFPLIEHCFFPVIPPFPLPASALASSTEEEANQNWDEGTSKGPACSQHGGPAATVTAHCNLDVPKHVGLQFVCIIYVVALHQAASSREVYVSHRALGREAVGKQTSFLKQVIKHNYIFTLWLPDYAQARAQPSSMSRACLVNTSVWFVSSQSCGLHLCCAIWVLHGDMCLQYTRFLLWSMCI